MGAGSGLGPYSDSKVTKAPSDTITMYSNSKDKVGELCSRKRPCPVSLLLDGLAPKQILSKWWIRNTCY